MVAGMGRLAQAPGRGEPLQLLFHCAWLLWATLEEGFRRNGLGKSIDAASWAADSLFGELFLFFHF